MLNVPAIKLTQMILKVATKFNADIKQIKKLLSTKLPNMSFFYFVLYVYICGMAS